MKLLTVKEAAELLNVNERTLRKWVESGRIPALKLGDRSIRFDEAELIEWIIAHKTGDV